MHRVSKLKLSEVTPYLVCKLCNGYLIDPCTAQDCLHTFCKTCIVNHLFNQCTCPICGVVIHKTRPLEMIRHDQTMQDLVYGLVPGVFRREMERRREFYTDHPDPDPNAHGNSEERGLVKDGREILADDDSISLALVHSPTGKAEVPDHSCGDIPTQEPIYLRCPANFAVSGIKKLLSAKFDLYPDYLVDIFHSDESLNDDYTLMDIAHIYTWKRRGPLRVFYSLYKCDTSTIKEEGQPGTEPAVEQHAAAVSIFKVDEAITITEITPNTEPNPTNNNNGILNSANGISNDSRNMDQGESNGNEIAPGDQSTGTNVLSADPQTNTSVNTGMEISDIAEPSN